MDPSLPLERVALLIVTAFVAGAVDAVAGGGGLLTLPALLSAGIPPHLAIGTNKGQSVFGSAAALFRYGMAGLVDSRHARIAFPLGFVGSLLGAGLLLWLDPKVLRPLVLVLLLAAGVAVTWLRPQQRATPPALRTGWRGLVAIGAIALGIGAYDGFFGPGTGTFLAVAHVVVLGLSLPAATAAAKTVNFAANLAAVLLFSSRGVVLWHVALPMAGAQFLGGLLGAHGAVRVGEPLIRRVLLGVVAALVLRLGSELLFG